jgi:transcription-repair coupling factor (superfamily II helicase)
MYCQLLETAVRRLKSQPVRTPLEVTVELPWPAFVSRDYLGMRQRVEVYRRLARVRKAERLDDFRQELRDRFGPPPEPVEGLLRLAELRLLAARWQIAMIQLEGNHEHRLGPVDVVFHYRNGRKIHSLAARSSRRLRIVDDTRAYLRLEPAEMEPLALYGLLKDLLRFPT